MQSKLPGSPIAAASRFIVLLNVPYSISPLRGDGHWSRTSAEVCVTMDGTYSTVDPTVVFVQMVVTIGAGTDPAKAPSLFSLIFLLLNGVSMRSA